MMLQDDFGVGLKFEVSSGVERKFFMCYIGEKNFGIFWMFWCGGVVIIVFFFIIGFLVVD